MTSNEVLEKLVKIYSFKRTEFTNYAIISNSDRNPSRFSIYEYDIRTDKKVCSILSGVTLKEVVDYIKLNFKKR